MLNDRPRQRVLEVGVGTGLSLPHFRSDAEITGIDVSPEMLAKAHRRADRLGISSRVRLLEMDAQAIGFGDDSFDCVLALYVASVVPDPAKFAAELMRVCVPGGRIVIVNHFSSTNPVMGRIERLLARYAGSLGFEPDFPLDEFMKSTGLDVREIHPGYWKLLRCVNTKAQIRP
jgi:phosphatidylethanolamine/phosphatidyl-N-methylethanolamine N-methyltransferase